MRPLGSRTVRATDPRRRIPRVGTGLAAGLLLAGFLAGLLLLPKSVGAEPPREPDAPDETEFEPAWPDSGGGGFLDFEPGSWDSVMAAYDANILRQRRAGITPEFGGRYDKAEGIHLEGGASIGSAQLRLLRLEGRFGYDIGRERPTGIGLMRFALIRPERLALEAQMHSGICVFGHHDPYGNTLLTVFGGYDARQYLLEKGGHVKLSWSFDSDRQVSIGWLRVDQSPVGVVATDHLFGDGRWMTFNEQAEREVMNGVQVAFRRQPPYLGETTPGGFVVSLEATTWGGEFLGTDREFTTADLDAWFTRPVKGGDAWQIRGGYSVAAGRAPRQAWTDLGGDAGLRAFPPRGYQTADTLVGTQRAVVRAEFQWKSRIFRKSRIPVLRKLGFKLIPYGEVGAVWGDPESGPLLRWEDLRAPKASEVHWDIGFALRQDIDYSGLLSYAQIDFAWPMGDDKGPARITVRFSRTGLD